MKVNVAGDGDGTRANASAAEVSALRQKLPTARYPSGVDTKTIPVPREAIRKAPAASVSTTVSWFDTATSGRPGSPASRVPFPLRSTRTTPEDPDARRGWRSRVKV